MAKSLPEIPVSFEQIMELAPLLLELFDLQRSMNDLPHIDPVSALLLAMVNVSEADGNPMLVEEVAFAFGMPVGPVKRKLKRLMKTGVIVMDGERYRYHPPRDMTPDEQRRSENIQREFNRLRPTMEKLQRPLDS